MPATRRRGDLAAAHLLLVAFTCSTGGEPAAAQDPRASSRADPRVGWYRMPEGDVALLSYSSAGGLRLFGFGEPLRWEHFRPGDVGTDLAWIPRDDGEPRVVRFLESEGAISGFTWKDANGATQLAEFLPAHGYAVEEVTVSRRETTLSGSLFLPRRAHGGPAAVMIHGSGQSDRDNYWYMVIADALARGGVAVLLPDKRGSGRSQGDWRSADLSELAADAHAQVDLLRQRPEIDADRIGLVGISQGGHLAPMVAADEELAFVVNVSGAAVPLEQQLRHEMRQTLRQDGWPRFLHWLATPISVAVVKRRNTDWWRRNGAEDPVASWRLVDEPALVVYGEEDERDNVPVRESVRRLEALKLDSLEVWVYEDSGHALYAPGSKRIRSDFLDGLVDWIHGAVAAIADRQR